MWPILLVSLVGAVTAEEWKLSMPGVKPNGTNQYLCKAFNVESELGSGSHYITEFVPRGEEGFLHHILVWGCEAPGIMDNLDDVWYCGDMHRGKSSGWHRKAKECKGSSGKKSIIYHWGKNAPALKLPEGVSFKVGDGSKIKYVVLELHYINPLKEKDSSGVTVTFTNQPTPRRAGLMLTVLATSAKLPPHQYTNLDAACVIEQDIDIHPFAFCPHTHKLGKLVSGWRARQYGEGGPMEWKLIGKEDPQKPQWFYPVDDPDMVIRRGDIFAGRCQLYNDRDKIVRVGHTGDDEMCDFYMMYWVEGDTLVEHWECASRGAPKYFWEKDKKLSNIPQKESTVPVEKEVKAATHVK